MYVVIGVICEGGRLGCRDEVRDGGKEGGVRGEVGVSEGAVGTGDGSEVV